MKSVLLSDIVIGVIGEFKEVERFKTKTYRDKGIIYNEVLDAYGAHRASLKRLASKSTDEVRPVFISDYYNPGDGTMRGDRETSFARRSLIYSDSVVVQDKIGAWFSLREAGADQGWQMGHQDFPNAIVDIWRVIQNASLEKSGLIEYLEFPSFARVKRISDLTDKDLLSPEELNSLDSIKSTALDYYRLRQDRAISLIEMEKIETVLSKHVGQLDIHLPSWLDSEFILNQLVRTPKSGTRRSAAVTSRDLRNAAGLSLSLNLPAPDRLGNDTFTDRDFRVMRESLYVRQFRNDFREIVDDYMDRSVGVSGFVHHRNVRENFQRRLEASRSKFLREVDKDGFDLRGVVNRGIVPGGVASAGVWAYSNYSTLDLAQTLMTTLIPFSAASIVDAWGEARRTLARRREAAVVSKMYSTYIVD
ncbi:hypothetical protein M3C37_011195 [Micrococcus luteus]|nr:hypothetical protein [Micrococcus luteus]